MDNVHGLFPWTLSMDNFHGHCPWIISMDIVHYLPGKNPWTYWKTSMDIIHGNTGNCPLFSFQYSSRTLSMDFVHGFCPLFPWTFYRREVYQVPYFQCSFLHWFSEWEFLIAPFPLIMIIAYFFHFRCHLREVTFTARLEFIKYK